MKYYNKALIYDIDGNIIKAIDSYEKSIKNNETSRSISNLLVMYWLIAFDLGFRQEYNLEGKKELFLKAYDKLLGLKTYAIERYYDDVEINFWIRYINHIDGVRDFSVSECKELISKGTSQLVPYFFLIQYSSKYIGKAVELYNEIKKEQTVKNKYILSILYKYVNID